MNIIIKNYFIYVDLFGDVGKVIYFIIGIIMFFVIVFNIIGGGIDVEEQGILEIQLEFYLYNSVNDRVFFRCILFFDGVLEIMGFVCVQYFFFFVYGWKI